MPGAETSGIFTLRWKATETAISDIRSTPIDERNLRTVQEREEEKHLYGTAKLARRQQREKGKFRAWKSKREKLRYIRNREDRTYREQRRQMIRDAKMSLQYLKESEKRAIQFLQEP